MIKKIIKTHSALDFLIIHGLAYDGCARSTSDSQNWTSYQNDTIIAIFFATNKNEDNAEDALASSNS